MTENEWRWLEVEAACGCVTKFWARGSIDGDWAAGNRVASTYLHGNHDETHRIICDAWLEEHGMLPPIHIHSPQIVDSRAE